jgi:hypothetical protein
MEHGGSLAADEMQYDLWHAKQRAAEVKVTPFPAP